MAETDKVAQGGTEGLYTGGDLENGSSGAVPGEQETREILGPTNTENSTVSDELSKPSGDELSKPSGDELSKPYGGNQDSGKVFAFPNTAKEAMERIENPYKADATKILIESLKKAA